MRSDITSSYFEGAYEQSDIVTFGYNRDGKRGHEQMVIGLLCSKEGCPVGVEVFAGNTKDASTVPEKIAAEALFDGCYIIASQVP